MQAHHGTSVSACLLLWLSLHLVARPRQLTFSFSPRLSACMPCVVCCVSFARSTVLAHKKRTSAAARAIPWPSTPRLASYCRQQRQQDCLHRHRYICAVMRNQLSLSLSRYVALRQLIDWSPLCYIAYHVGGQKQYRFDVPDWGV